MPVLEKCGEPQQTERNAKAAQSAHVYCDLRGYSYWCYLLILRAVIGDTSSTMPLSEPFFEMLSASSSSWLALLESSGAQAA